ncbi:MAG: DUF480 domain-containing protein [Spartobacteria bacterium]|nr:DUF480 domain-containing protein [Spartobacteria bacterium]
MLPTLTTEEVRILGCLIEKAMTTPDYYPMTINALVAACNQKSNRQPVMELYDKAVKRALDNLRVNHHLSCLFSASGSRVPKFMHTLDEQYGLSPEELAVLSELFLRGPQTPGELRGRCSRMADFPDISTVDTALSSLMSAREECFVKQLPVQTGRREARWIHLFGGEIDEEEEDASSRMDAEETPYHTAEEEKDRIALLEQEISTLKQQIDELKAAFDAFRDQFS